MTARRDIIEFTLIVVVFLVLPVLLLGWWLG